eukprot:scaffold79530_cov29-Tisochrysis_lutea.AAC.2
MPSASWAQDAQVGSVASEHRERVCCAPSRARNKTNLHRSIFHSTGRLVCTHPPAEILASC